MSYVTRSGSQFMHDGVRFRFVGMNYYPAIVSMDSQSTVQALFADAKANGISVIRTWCFDSGNPPTNSGGNFRYLTSAGIGSNIISNSGFETNTSGWSLDADYTRSSADAHNGSFSIAQNSAGGFHNFTTVNDGTGIVVSANTSYTLQFWYKLSVTGNGPIMNINTGNAFGTTIASAFPGGTGGVWTQGSITFNTGSATNVWIRIFNNNGTVTGFWDDFTMGIGTGHGLSPVAATLAQLDMVLNEASKQNIKLILSLADNPTYNTKLTYVNWANTIFGTSLSTSYPYTGFFDDTGCRTLYKNFVNLLANRVNTINGRTYNADDTIFAWELGNELRYDVFTSEGGTQNTINSTDIAAVKSWIIDVAAYIKTQDSNHMISYGDMGHTWQWASGDTVSNGSGYGVDYNIFSGLTNIDYLDFHTYPDQSDNVNLMEYGQRLGFPNAVSGDGYRAQLKDYVTTAKANGKPAICGEVGFIKETIGSDANFPLYPRHEAFRAIFDTFFGADGDGMILWSATTTSGGSYSVVLNGWDGTYSNENSDDRMLMWTINALNTKLIAPTNRPRIV